MSFWGEVEGWGDLHNKIRKNLITSCSQHSSAEKMFLDKIIQSSYLDPIRSEISEVCANLSVERSIKPGKKSYDTMIAAYFSDLAQVWEMLRYHVAKGGVVYFVVGDSAPYGVHVPAERWLGELAMANGFKSWTFEKVRDRNIKWKTENIMFPCKKAY